MEPEWTSTTIGASFQVNPTRNLALGTETVFVPMDAISEHQRLPDLSRSRTFTGSGIKFRNGDTLLARITPCLENGKTAFVVGLSEDEVAHGSTEYIVLSGRKDHSDSLYAYYVCRSPDFRAHAISHMEGTSGRQRVPVTAVANYQLNLPRLDDQQRIAEILGTLDDKIELNRRMAATLEEMARAIFKSWFIDFDPVRAKAEGRPTNLPPEIDALFPSSFEHSELGPIPPGWSITSIGKLVEFSYGKALKAENRVPGNVRVYGSNGQVGWHNEKIASGPGVIVGRKGNPGTVTWTQDDFFVIDTAFFIAPLLSEPCIHFLFHALQKHDFASLGADSAVPGLNRNLAYSNLQILPTPECIEAFENIVAPLFRRLHLTCTEASNLGAIRDSLLPRLISGEIQVTD